MKVFEFPTKTHRLTNRTFDSHTVKQNLSNEAAKIKNAEAVIDIWQIVINDLMYPNQAFKIIGSNR